MAHEQNVRQMWSQFLSQYSTQGQDDITNTRIGSRTLQIHGGKYSIPDDKYLKFLGDSIFFNKFYLIFVYN